MKVYYTYNSVLHANVWLNVVTFYRAFCRYGFHFNDLATIVIIVFHIFFTQRNESENEWEAKYSISKPS